MHLSKEERLKIELLRRQTKEKKSYVRLSVLIMLDAGFIQEDIALSLGIDSDTVSSYKKKYQEKGLDAYLQDNYVAYQGELSQEQLQAVDLKVQAGLYQTARQVGDWIYGQYQVDYTDSAVRAILHKLDFVHKQVKRVPCKADATLQAAFVEAFNRLIADLTEDTLVYFADATHPTHNTQAGKAWVKKGQEKCIPANAGRKRVNINGAVNALDPCQTVVVEAERVNAQNTIILYEKLLEKNPGKNLVIICDNAPYYRSQVLEQWLSTQPLIKQWFLPTYSPNLNPIERMWGFLKQKVIGLNFYPSFKEFKGAVLHFFDHLDDYEYELRNLLNLQFQILEAPLPKTT